MIYFSSQDAESASSLCGRMKGAGGVGGGWHQPGQPAGPPPPPGGQCHTSGHTLPIHTPLSSQSINECNTNTQWVQDADTSVCVCSCESPSRGRRDVASCCYGGTCNNWFVSSVKRNTSERKNKLISHDFPSRHAVYCVPPPDAQQAVLSPQQQAMVSQQAVIMVNLRQDLFPFICPVAPPLNEFHAPFPRSSGSADDQAGDGYGRQPGDEPAHLAGHEPSHEPPAPPPSQPLRCRTSEPVRQRPPKPLRQLHALPLRRSQRSAEPLRPAAPRWVSAPGRPPRPGVSAELL